MSIGFNITVDIYDKVREKHKKLLQKVEEKYNALKIKADDNIRKKGGETLLKCPKCGKRSQVKKFHWAELYYYIPPVSCTAGDYNKHVGIIVACPKCKWTLNLYKDESDDLNDENRENYWRVRSLVEEFGVKCEDEYTK
jgi:predicted nucleic-acid-binding Zn-ribbon protein